LTSLGDIPHSVLAVIRSAVFDNWSLFEVDLRGKSLCPKSKIWCNILISKLIFRCTF